MKCFISGRHLPDEKKLGLVSFAIPDYGILFRSLAEGSRTDLEMIALFSLLRFASHNSEIFAKRELLVHTDYQLLAYLMDVNRVPEKNMRGLRREARRIADGLTFTVRAISDCKNRAAEPVADFPVLPENSGLKIKTFSSLTIKEPLDPFSIRPDSKSR